MKRPLTTQTCQEDASTSSDNKVCAPYTIGDETLIEWQKQTLSTDFLSAINNVAQGSTTFTLMKGGWFIDSEIDCIISIFPYVNTIILDNYDISFSQMARLTEALKHNDTIVALSLKNTNIGYEGAESLADMLLHNNTLRILYLSHNHIGARGAKLICEGIQNNPDSALMELNLRYNHMNLEETLAVYSPLIELKPYIRLYSEYPEICTALGKCY